MGEMPGPKIPPASAPEVTPSGILQFSPRALAVFENLNFPVLTLTGSSIREVGSRRPVSVVVLDDGPIYEIRGTATQVALNPNSAMVLPWRRSYMDNPKSFNRERRQRFATMLPRPSDAQDMLFALGNPADYAELALLGDPAIEHVLFGEFRNANVMTNHVTVGERTIKGDAGAFGWLGPVKDETLPPLIASVGLDNGKIVIADFRADYMGTNTSSPERNVTALRVVPLIFPADYMEREEADAA